MSASCWRRASAWKSALSACVAAHRGQACGEVVHRPGGHSGPVIAAERLGQRADAAEPVGDGIGQQFRVAER